MVPLVQSLSHHINVFLVEYNKYNNLQLNLPGFRLPCPAEVEAAVASGADVTVPEDVLHQQRLLLQTCDRLKLSVSRFTMLQTGMGNGATLPTAAASLNSESAVVDVITQVGATFTKLIELMLSKEIKVKIVATTYLLNSRRFGSKTRHVIKTLLLVIKLR